MKPIIFAVFFIGLALNARAQFNQQTDNTAVASPWIQANSPSHACGGVSYVSFDTCWAVTSDSTGLILSTDGGLNWNWAPHPPSGVFFYNAHFGYCFNSTTTFRTTNGGMNWDSVGPTPPTIINGNLLGASLPDSIHIFTCGTNDMGFSTDGGKTWNDISENSTTRSFSALNSQIVYGVGDPVSQYGSSVIKTSNGGISWTQQPDSIVGGLRSVAVIDSQTVIACGNGIFKTTNSGYVWKRVFFNSSQGFYKVVMNGANGFACCLTNTIYRTTDTGNTWVEESMPVNKDFNLALMYDDSIGVGSSACFGTGHDTVSIVVRRPDLAGVNQNPSMDSLQVSTFPDPAQNTITFSYSLPESQHMTLLIYDLSGNLIQTFLQSALQVSGAQTVLLNTTSFSSGSFYYQFSSESFRSSGSFTIIR